MVLKSGIGTPLALACYACLKLVHLSRQFSTKIGRGNCHFAKKNILVSAFLNLQKTFILFIPLLKGIHQLKNYNALKCLEYLL